MGELSDKQSRIHDYLSNNPLGVLSTIGGDGRPYGSVVYFTIDQRFHLAFITKSGTRKYDSLLAHPQVMLTVYEAASQTTVTISGQVEEVKNVEMIAKISGQIVDTSMKTSSGNVPPITKLEAGDYVAFRLIPEQIRMAVYSRPDSGTSTDLFELLEGDELK